MTTVNLQGNPVALAGDMMEVGAQTSQISLVASDLTEKKVGGASDKIQLLSVVPSIDTGVCATQTKVFNEKATALDGVEIVTISMDLPFAAGRFCGAEGIKNVVFASDFRNKDFAKVYGVLIADGPMQGLTCRAIFLIDKTGKLAYKELVPEITQEPDYDKALEALRNLS